DGIRGFHVTGVQTCALPICVYTGLLEGVERRAGRTARDEPGFHIAQRRVVELTVIPDPVAVTADQVRTRVAVGLRVDDQHRFADLGLQRAFARQCAHLAVEHDVR